RDAQSSQPSRDAQSPPTELSSSQGIRGLDTAPRAHPRKRGGFVGMLGIVLLAAGGAAAAVMRWGQKPPLGRFSSSSASAPEPVSDALTVAVPTPTAPRSAALAVTPQSVASTPVVAPSGSAVSAPQATSAAPVSAPVAVSALGVPWPGTQFRQVPSGTLEGGPWLDGFRIVRRPDA